MWSYKSDRGRVPRPRHFMSQNRNASSPVTSSAKASTGTSALKSPDQQKTTTTKTGPSPPTSRSLSCSEAEEARPVAATARPRPSKIPSSNDVRLSLLPRPAAANPTTSMSDQNPNSSQTADRSTQQTENSERQMPAKGRPDNTLRRKAPTIGKPSTQESQRTETERPERLRVVIPSTPRPGQFTNTNATPRMPWGQAEMVKNESSSSIPSAQAAGKSTEPPALEGPKELASLRTTVNTQNLPPSTLPNYPSASTPSTRYSSSPGIWSRGSTPTSMSSCSPGIVYPSKVGPRLRQISPSETKLPVFSPLTQYPSPQSDLAERMSIKSPKLDKGNESSTTLANAERGEAPKTTDSTKSPSSALPRRTSVNSSSVPGRIKVDTQTNRRGEEKTERRTSGLRGVQSPSSANKSKDSVPTPSRPTREGTDQLELEPSPVIQSHLPPKTVSSHKRRESSENNIPTAKQLSSSSNQSAATSTDSFHSRRPSRKSSLTTSPVPMPQKFSRTSSREQQGKQDTKSPTTPTSATTKRFGIFSRKPKPDTDAHGSDQSRLPRKGPAAGTGHEGYGKYGRKGSTGSSSGARTRSTSVSDSVPKLASGSKGNGKGRPEQEIDDFLRSRLEPVVINGGGVDGTTLSRTESEQSMGASSTVSASNTAQNVLSPHSTVCSTETLATSGTTGEPRGRKGSNDNGSAGQSRLPAAKKISHHATASNSSVDHPKTILPGNPSQGKEQKQSKKGKGFRSFFQRSHSKQRKESNPETSTSSAPHLHAKITPVAANRPVAHYALFDTDEDPLEDIIHDVEESPPTEYEDEPDQPVEIPPALNIQKNRQSVLLPSLPDFQTEHRAGRNSPPKVYMNKNFGFSIPKIEKSPKEKRPSRLASIGRIPQVISRRDRQHKPASQSFSRPFSITESPSVAAPVTDLLNEPQAPTSETDKSPGKPSSLGFDLTQPFGDPTQGSVLDLLAGPYSGNEFLHFSPDKNSSLSSGDSKAATGVPNPNAEPADDEIWKEYDDLIDHVFSPVTPSTEPGSGLSDPGDNFELAALASKTLQAELNAHRELPPLPTLVEHPSVGANRSSGDSVRLRRSRIASALRSSYAPSSQPSYGDLNAGQSDHQDKEGTEKSDLDHSIQPIEEASFLPSPLNPSQSFEVCRQRNTILFDIAERDREGPTAQTNIRSGSLMTSRWLSFGRVLFSPAHNHVKTGEQERILVIDGLGNDDWSFYCALTYANADVYNLHVGPNAATSSHPAAWQPPANYHTVHHPNLADKFPFPMGFFAATVLRFPAACSEHVQDSIVSECKRVLRPGGYMEMSILDLDMVNMGIRTRKAVRGLKERTYLADSNISLKPASDSIQRLLGRHNFDNLHRCMVRIPVAGVITRSSASSSSTSSSSLHPSMSIPAAIRSAPSFGQGNGQTEQTPITTTTTANHYHHHNHDNNKHGKSPSNDTDLSLGDLLADPMPSQSNDESIRKIVAKVGRWWYTRCYEIPVLPDGDVDLRIWSDKKVLRECQKRGTGFRLLIAHAQKPSEVNRRTASV